jgi:fatty acid desaturase
MSSRTLAARGQTGRVPEPRSPGVHVPPANEAGLSHQPLPAFPPDSASSSSPLRGSEYAMLSRQIRQARLLDRRLRYYAAKIAVTAAALVAGWAAFALIGDSWWQLGIAVYLAVMFGQLGFLGHDAGHQQIFRSRKANYLFGVACGNLGIGLSFGWWTSKHNRHHAHPNTEDADPDIMIGVLAFSGGQAQAAQGVRRLVFRCQAFLLFPMMFLEAASLHGASLRAVTRRIREHRAGQHGAWEAALLTLHAAGYLTAVFLVLSPVRAVLFILVQQGLFGFYLACSFAPNHKGMPVLEAGDRTDFLRRQVLTSRNVRGGWLTDAALGGLNYQIEHHLFPSMPRPSLRRAQPLVAAFCADRGLPYCQTSLLGSYAQALRHLSSVGKLTGPAADAGTDPHENETGPPEKMPPSDRRRVAWRLESQ